MIESLRGLGYSAPTALADLIDNSISAEAKVVELFFHWDGPASHVLILDDGKGMTPEMLDRAMRLGDRSPLDQREPGDLGRFGLGLKTASFSQCRILTVASTRGGTHDCLRWDLDVLAESRDDGWHLLEGPNPGSECLLELLASRPQGTLVIWEKPDRLVTEGSTLQDFLDLIDLVAQHLSLVFHRFLEGASPRLTIWINGKAIQPWDPFLSSHQTTWSFQEEPLRCSSGTVWVQPFILPHKDKLDRALHDRAAEPDGWTAQQGFYVYRNERLLVAGSWLGLGPGKPWSKEEAYRLARIRVDIPNTADAEWRIDIRKSEARPPAAHRIKLTRIAEDVREKARGVFAHRGELPRASSQPIIQAWRADRTAAGIRYRIENTHPAVRNVLDQAGPLLPAIRAMLRVIEETVPVQRIWLDTTAAQEIPLNAFAAEAPEAVTEVLAEVFLGLLSRGMDADAAREKLLRTDPFHKYPKIVASLVGPAKREDEA
jgi:hypothetical protein